MNNFFNEMDRRDGLYSFTVENGEITETAFESNYPDAVQRREMEIKRETRIKAELHKLMSS
jgi:hypothetical protein